MDRFLRSPQFQLLLNEADYGMVKDYQLSYGLLLAADHGVAQRRLRTIVIGSRIGPIPLPLMRYDCVPPGGGRFDLPDELLPDC